MTETSPYFVAHARSAFHRAGGDPDLAGPLAAWAQAAKDRNYITGVIVAENGQLLAETAPAGRGEHITIYVSTALVPEAVELVGWEVGMAVSSARRYVGKRAVEFRRGDLCYGASRHITRV